MAAMKTEVAFYLCIKMYSNIKNYLYLKIITPI